MISGKETHDKIIQVLNEKGPSLPVHIAKAIEMSSLFVSAFLSEMVSEKKIVVSNLKVGGSPLYYLKGQEDRLESFSNHLHPKEHEAFILLRDKKILKESEQEPAIRVALRSIKDFSREFNKDGEVYWKYFSVSDEDVRRILEPSFEKEVKKNENISEGVVDRNERREEEVKKVERDSPVSERVVSGNFSEESNEFGNPLVMKEIKKEKTKSEFSMGVVDFINQKGFRIVEEREHKAREYNCVLRIRSELGVIDFFCQAKDKKKISESDLKKLLSDSQKIPLPALLIYKGDLSKKAEEYFEKYWSVLKRLKLG